MASTFDSTQELNHVEEQENDIVSLPSSLPLQTVSDDLRESLADISEDKNEEQEPINESEETDMTTNNINDDTSETDITTTTTMLDPTNMVTAEASFTEATSADIPLGATRSSVARILVKPGQIFRVQVDNEVKEVHGKIYFYYSFD